MTMYAGEGVHVAMTDAMCLAEAIINGTKEGRSFDEGLKSFEGEMFKRAEGEASPFLMQCE